MNLKQKKKKYYKRQFHFDFAIKHPRTVEQNGDSRYVIYIFEITQNRCTHQPQLISNDERRLKVAFLQHPSSEATDKVSRIYISIKFLLFRKSIK